MHIEQLIEAGPPNLEQLLAHLNKNLRLAHNIMTHQFDCTWTYEEPFMQLICNHGITFCLNSTLRECHFRDN